MVANSRRAFGEQLAYEPNANDVAALSEIEHFEFGQKDVVIPFYKCTESDEEDELMDQNELLFALEGLCWE